MSKCENIDGQCGASWCDCDYQRRKKLANDSRPSPCSILPLTLTRKWFDMIASGEKREEYREIKSYWEKRLDGRHYDAVKFVNGYGSHRPWMLVELLDIRKAVGIPAWGGNGQMVYVLRLGAILESKPKIRRESL